jgi:carboxypeptidase C (cathepsin A)
MTSLRIAALFSIGLGLAGSATLQADAKPATRPLVAQQAVSNDTVVTANHVMIGGKALNYHARTGFLPIYSDTTGELMAKMFFVAYTTDHGAGAPTRPLTFIWNGGPGSSASESHLLGFGPKGYVTPATFPEWKSPPETIADRPETLLQSSDLVFLDPIGTGYSRATSEANRDLLYTTHGDAEAVAEAIRVYRTRYDAFNQPLFISGESYGTTRAMNVAWDLVRRRTPLNGVILISGEYELGQSMPKELEQALQVPMFAATGYYHKALAPELQILPLSDVLAKATAWARTDYADALSKTATLTPEQRKTVLVQLKAFTGIDPQFVDAKALVLDKETDLDRLLDTRSEELGRYDSRMTTARRDLATPWVPVRDPSLMPVLDMMQGTSPALIRYLRGTLGFKSDLLYKGPFGEGFHPAPLFYVVPGISDDWMTLWWNKAAKPSNPPSQPPLVEAMQQDASLHVLNVRGLYDLSCAAQDEALARTSAAFRSRVRNRCYPSGHAIYTDAAVRQAFQADFAAFVREAAHTP